MTYGGQHADRATSGAPGWILGLVPLTLVATVAFALAANLPVSPATLATTVLPASNRPLVTATVDVGAGRLATKASGRALTAGIVLPGNFDAASIVVGTVRLCLGTTPCGPGGVPARHPRLQTHHGEHELRVRFDRASVDALLGNVTPPATVSFTVSGAFGSGAFTGTDRSALIGPG